jgi:hypothetical protein
MAHGPGIVDVEERTDQVVVYRVCSRLCVDSAAGLLFKHGMMVEVWARKEAGTSEPSMSTELKKWGSRSLNNIDVGKQLVLRDINTHFQHTNVWIETNCNARSHFSERVY